MIKISTLFVVIILAFVGVTHGQSGTSSANFLRIEPDARSGGMAGVGAIVLDGGYAGYYNPAILGWQRGTSAGFSYSNWLAGISSDYRYNHVSGGLELSNRSSISGNITYLNLGEQMATDENNVQLGRFSSYQMAAGLSYGRLIGTNFSLGFGGKFIYSSLGSGQFVDGIQIEPAASAALDVGALYRTDVWQMGGMPSEFRFGVGISNIGPGLRYTEDQKPNALPQIFRAGIGLEVQPGQRDLHKVLLSTDVTRLLTRMEKTVSAGDTTWNSMSPLRSLYMGWGSVERFNGQEIVELRSFEQFGLGAGVEYWYNNLFALRSGYYVEHRNNGGRQFVTLGTGLRYGSAEVDFSYLIATQRDHPLDGTVRFSLKLNFSKGGYQSPREVVSKHQIIVDQFVPVIITTPVAIDTLEYEEPEVVPQTVVISPVPSVADDSIIQKLTSINVDLTGFATMSSKLSQVQKDAIARAVILLQSDRNVTIHVSGHTDDRGSQALNDMLSQARARAIYLEMLSYGVLDWSRVSIQGYGSSQPLVEESGEAAGRANRRGELSFPATEHSLLWILEKPSFALIDLSLQPDKPVNSGTEFRFNWLEIKHSVDSQRWLHSLASHLLEHPKHKLNVANVVNYSRGGRLFMRELEKARSEFLKDLLIQLGVPPSQIEVITDENDFWKDYVESLPSGPNTEKIWFFISN